MTPRLRQRYANDIVPRLMKDWNYRNVMETPRPTKVVVNMGVSAARDDKTALDSAMKDMERITGQRPQMRRAKKSVANFRIREGMPIGCRVTLRGNRMYEFLDRLVAMALPRIRDFRGMSSSSFDGRGNYSIGVTEQTIFPEIHYDDVDTVRGLDIVIVTSAKTDAEGLSLLTEMGFPFRQS